MPERKTYSVKETANILGVTQSMVYKLVRNKTIPHMQIGKRIVIPMDSFDEWFNMYIKGGLRLCEVL